MDRVKSTSSTRDASRLAALHALNLLDTAPEEAFDRLTRLVARYLGAPVALLSLVDDHRQFFKSAIGLEEPWASRRETPLSHAFCRFVVESRAPLVVENANEHPIVGGHPGIAELGIVAYAGVPLETQDGHVLGSLCAIDSVPHAWSPMDIEVLHDLAASVMAEVELRAEVAERRRAQALAASQQRVLERAALGQPLPDVLGEVINLVEQWSPSVLGAIVYVDRDRRRFRVGAAPTLPPALRLALSELGCDSTSPIAKAVRDAVAVHVDDSETSSEWTDRTRWRATEHGLRSCSTLPIVTSNGVIGALVLFSAAAVAPRDVDSSVLDAATHLVRMTLERSAAEHEHRINEARFRALVENVQAGFFMVELPEWHLTYESPGVAALYGWPRETAHTRDPMAWLAHVHEDDRARVTEALASNLERPLGIDYRIRRTDGEVRHVHDRTFFVRGVNGVPTHLVGLVTDVTDARRSDQERRRALEHLQTLVDTAPLAIIEADKGGVVLRWNPAAEQIFGYTAAEVVGKPYPLLPSGGAAELDRIKSRIFAGHGYDGMETQRRRKDGSVVDVLVSSVLIRDANGTPTSVVGFLTDVSERKNLEDGLRHAQKMEAIGQLAGGVAHDFNNLLTAILGNIDIARSELGAGHPVHEPLGDAQDAAARAATLTRQLLTFSRKHPFEPTPLDLNTVIRDASKLLRRALDERAVLDLALSDESPIAMADAGQIEQVLMNLVVNARDAMPNGGIATVESGIIDVTRHRDVNTRELPPGRYARLAVRDTGVGIPPDVTGRVFEPFFTTKPVGQGTGLGLAAVYGIVQQLDGTVHVESEPGRGSVVTVLIPLVTWSESPPLPVSAPPVIPRGTERVLLVEDETNVRTLVKRLLERRGYSVHEARHGADARLVWKEQAQHIDLVLTDLRMPEMGGVELVEKLRADRPDVPVLFMSGYAGSDESAATQLALSETVVMKPFTEDALLGAVRRKLDGRSRS